MFVKKDMQCLVKIMSKFVRISVFQIDIVEVNKNGNYLSASVMPLPTLYFALSFAYVVMAIVWNTVLCKSKDTVYKMHYLMLVVVFVKSLSCLFHAVSIENIYVFTYSFDVPRGAYIKIALSVCSSKFGILGWGCNFVTIAWILK